ncbi:RNA-binding protein 34-like isoform X2 [Bacillus rossius redtenbacheri]|uniref:RNA-binding protein 34-like isoform X2 n=1 Tax=Bacillus rossius redtenbacheri TaxID=93214 RepID=UPI002FDE9A62
MGKDGIAKKRPNPDGVQPRKPKNSKKLKLSHPEASSNKEQPPIESGVKKRKHSKINVSAAVESGVTNGSLHPKKAKHELESVDGLPAATPTTKEEKEKKYRKMFFEMCTVYLGNLPSSWNKKDIKNFFSKYGPVKELALLAKPVVDSRVSKNLNDRQKLLGPGCTKMIGFLRFGDKQSAINALQANGLVKDDHSIQVHSAVDYSAFGYEKSKTIYVHYIPDSAKESDLRTLFKNCGAVESVHIVQDRIVNGTRMASVHFKLSEAADLALEMNGVELKNKELVIKKYNVWTGKKISRMKRLSKRAEEGDQATEVIKETNVQERTLSETKKLKKASNAEKLASKANGVQMQGGRSQISDRPTGVKKRKKEAKQNGIQGGIAEVSQSAGKLKKQVKKATSTGQLETVQQVEPSLKAKKAKLQGKTLSVGKMLKEKKKNKALQKNISNGKHAGGLKKKNSI